MVSNDLTSRVAVKDDRRETKGTDISEAELVSAADSKSVRGCKASSFTLLSVSFLLQVMKEPRGCRWNQFSARRSVPSHAWGGPSGGHQLLHPWVNEGKVPEHVLVHTVDQCPVGERQPGLLV